MPAPIQFVLGRRLLSCWLLRGRLKHTVALVLKSKMFPLQRYPLLSASAHEIGRW